MALKRDSRVTKDSIHLVFSSSCSDSFVVVFPTFAKFILFFLSFSPSGEAHFLYSTALYYTISARLVTQIRVTTRTRKKGTKEAERGKKAKVLPKMAWKKMGMDTERKRKGGKVEPKHETRRTTVGGAEFDHFNLVFFSGRRK